MLDSAARKTPATGALQRVRGKAVARFVSDAGQTRLKDLHQAGSGKALLPAVHGQSPEVVFLNTAGGLTGGDVLDLSLEAGPDCAVVGTTQTAERAYASPGGAAQVRVSLAAGRGARLDWLPQETILFDRSALERQTRLDLAPEAQALMVETICLGRAAMGEVVSTCALYDRREIWREGRLFWREPLHLEGAAGWGSAARLAEMRAISTLVLVAQGAEDAVEPLRARLACHGSVASGVSGWDGRLVLRLAAPDLWPLRGALIDVMMGLRGRLPRVWQM